MSARESDVRIIANTLATVALRFNMTGKQPSDLYHAMAEHLADAQLVQSPETAAELEHLRAQRAAVPYVLGDSKVPKDLREQLVALLTEMLRQGVPGPALTGGMEAQGEMEAALSQAFARKMYPAPGLFPSAAEQAQQLRGELAELKAKLAEYERPADEDPIRYALTEQAEATYPPALPWAALMDDEDLAGFLDELAASAITHASSETALAEVEATCGRWRVIAEAQHAHNTAPGPDAEDDVTPQVQKLRALLAGQRQQANGDAPHEGDEQEAVRRSVDAQFPTVAAFLRETGGERP